MKKGVLFIPIFLDTSLCVFRSTSTSGFLQISYFLLSSLPCIASSYAFAVSLEQKMYFTLFSASLCIGKGRKKIYLVTSVFSLKKEEALRQYGQSGSVNSYIVLFPFPIFTALSSGRSLTLETMFSFLLFVVILVPSLSIISPKIRYPGSGAK